MGPRCDLYCTFIETWRADAFVDVDLTVDALVALLALTGVLIDAVHTFTVYTGVTATLVNVLLTVNPGKSDRAITRIIIHQIPVCQTNIIHQYIY